MSAAKIRIGAKAAALAASISALAGCGAGRNVPPPLPSIELPKAAELKPWSASDPSKAWPQAVAQLGGKIYVALGNLSATDPYLPPAGPGLLVGVVPSTGAQTVVDLGGADGHQCSNAGAVSVDGGKLYVTCSGPFGSADGRALVEVDPAGAGSVKRVAAMPADFVPGPVAVAGNRIWIGDLSGDRVLGVDRATFQADAQPVALSCGTQYPFISSLLVVGADLYALCAATDGYLYRLDAQTGQPKGDRALVGALPIALAHLADGRIAVANSVSATLTLVTPGASLSVAKDVLAFTNSADLEDVRTFGHFVYVVSASTKTIIKVDVAGAQPRIVDEVNVNPAGDSGSNPTKAEVLDDNLAVVCDSGLGRVIGVQFGSKE